MQSVDIDTDDGFYAAAASPRSAAKVAPSRARLQRSRQARVIARRCAATSGAQGRALAKRPSARRLFRHA